MSPVIAITGASGFIGRRTVEVMAAAGLRIRALVRRPERLSKRERATLEIVHGDLSDEAALAILARGAHAIVHCAGEVADPRRFEAVNIEGTRRLALAGLREGVSRFVHVSSLAAREHGLSAYGESKRAGETVMCELAGSLTSILRPPAVYGPGDRATLPLIAQLTRSTAILPGTSDQRFSLIHVDDLARALMALAVGPLPNAGLHELHDGRQEGYRWAEIAAIAGRQEGRRVRMLHVPRAVLGTAALAAEAWSRSTGRRPALTRGKVAELYHPDWVCRHDLLDRTCDWRPGVGFAQGFSETLDWYRKQRWLPSRGAGTRTRQAQGKDIEPA